MGLRGFSFGAYELLARLPGSAPTQTFLARQRGADSFKKLVCVRTLLPAHARDEGVVEAFLAEARLAAHLNHPACVTTYDLGRERGAYFISMEYVVGETLSALVDAATARRDPLPEPLVASLVADFCDGLHSAHALRDPSGRAAQLIHGDLSPRNLVVTYEGYPKILDFGVAGTKTEHRGRVRYAPPEALGERTKDRRTDVYALGLVLFELLAARALGPKTAEERSSWVLAAARAPRLSTLLPGLHPALAAVVERALAPHRDARHASAEELAEALRGYLAQAGSAERRSAIADLLRAHFEARAVARTRTLQRLLRGDCPEAELEGVLGARSVADLELLFEEERPPAMTRNDTLDADDWTGVDLAAPHALLAARELAQDGVPATEPTPVANLEDPPGTAAARRAGSTAPHPPAQAPAARVPEEDTELFAATRPGPSGRPDIPADGRRLFALVPPLEVRGASTAHGAPASKIHERVSAPARTPLPRPEPTAPTEPQPDLTEPQPAADDTRRIDTRALLGRDARAEEVAESFGEATALLGRPGSGYVTRKAAMRMLLTGVALGVLVGVLIAAAWWAR